MKLSARKQFLVGLQCAACSVACATVDANAATATIAAIPGKPDVMLGSFDVATVGYSVSEYSIGGTATSFTLKGEASTDGHWTASPADSAPYKTRLVAVLPSDRSKFNGTVIVEWMNVTGGLDVPVDWITTHREITRGGYAYIGVSAQKVGVEGGASLARGTARTG